MAFGEDASQPDPGTSHDLVEVAARVSQAEAGGPTAEEPVEVLHDLLDGRQQPAPVGECTDPVAADAAHDPAPASEPGSQGTGARRTWRAAEITGHRTAVITRPAHTNLMVERLPSAHEPEESGGRPTACSKPHRGWLAGQLCDKPVPSYLYDEGLLAVRPNT
jgi:hypothetical protein